MALDTDYVCDLLLSVGKITDEQAEETRQKAGDGSVDVLGALEALGFATEEETLATLASEYGMETFDLGNYSLSDDDVQAITPEVAQR